LKKKILSFVLLSLVIVGLYQVALDVGGYIEEGHESHTHNEADLADQWHFHWNWPEELKISLTSVDRVDLAKTTLFFEGKDLVAQNHEESKIQLAHEKDFLRLQNIVSNWHIERVFVAEEWSVIKKSPSDLARIFPRKNFYQITFQQEKEKKEFVVEIGSNAPLSESYYVLWRIDGKEYLSIVKDEWPMEGPYVKQVKEGQASPLYLYRLQSLIASNQWQARAPSGRIWSHVRAAQLNIDRNQFQIAWNKESERWKGLNESFLNFNPKAWEEWQRDLEGLEAEMIDTVLESDKLASIQFFNENGVSLGHYDFFIEKEAAYLREQLSDRKKSTLFLLNKKSASQIFPRAHGLFNKGPDFYYPITLEQMVGGVLHKVQIARNFERDQFFVESKVGDKVSEVTLNRASLEQLEKALNGTFSLFVNLGSKIDLEKKIDLSLNGDQWELLSTDKNGKEHLLMRRKNWAQYFISDEAIDFTINDLSYFFQKENEQV
jgi:hypothetical protein